MNGDRLDLQMRHARKHAIKTNDFEANQIYRDLIAHVLRPDEKLGEFVARVGFSPVQAMGMSKIEISDFVATAETRLLQDPCEPSAWRRINRIPDHPAAHFVLED
jgi:hypothetical protein